MDGGGGSIFPYPESEPCGGAGGGGGGRGVGQKPKRGKLAKGDSVSVGTGSTQKKMLADITNLQQWCVKPLNQQDKKQSSTLAEADISTEQLLTENAMLKKILANRNSIIEKCKSELEKSQINFQKLQKQNSELALTNSRMLAELNSSRQRLREVQHELVSQSCMLKAMKLESTAKERTEKLIHESNANEVGASQGQESDQSHQENNEGVSALHAKRKRVSRSQSSVSAAVKQVKSAENVDNQRYCLRRSSVYSKAEKPGPKEDNFEADGIKCDVSNLQENLAIEEAREDTPSSGPTNTEQVHDKKNIENKSHRMRRQSARFIKPENPEPTEDLIKVDDAKCAVSHSCDNMSEKSGSVNPKQENKENNAYPQVSRRSSMRRTAEKVVSYKEVPLNVKMRRPN